MIFKLIFKIRIRYIIYFKIETLEIFESQKNLSEEQKS